MNRRIRHALAAAALALTVAAAPVAVSAHNVYCGYGKSGWDSPRFGVWVQDSWTGYQSGGTLQIFHDYQGFWAPSDYYSLCRIY